MTFDEALKIELETINGLSGKVFPIVAPQKATVPYLVYRKGNAKFKKTLDGVTIRAEGIYGIVLITKKYSDLQQLTANITDKLLSFLHRTIGDASGPLIQNITVELTGDEYEQEVDQLSAGIQMTVNY